MIKRTIHIAFVDLLTSRIRQAQKRIDDIEESSRTDTKSSAGDKFETSREMMKQEADKAYEQLSQFLIQKKQLFGLSPKEECMTVGKGAYVETNKGCFYISASLGKTLVNDKVIYAISEISPMAQALKGRKINDEVTMKGQQIRILSVS